MRWRVGRSVPPISSGVLGGRTNGVGWPRHPGDKAEMKDTSINGVQILRALALAVRSEQDFGLLPPDSSIVGAVKKEDAVPSDAIDVKQACGFQSILKRAEYEPLPLRQALNKIAHANPESADYYIGPLHSNHDLLLYGDNRGKQWFAAISILELIRVIRALPDLECSY